MSTRSPFAPGEWYHCYARGIDKRRTFETAKDYKRFLELLYLVNDTRAAHRSNLGQNTVVFDLPRTEPLVGVGAFCLMPNHFHLLLKEVREGGISAFMQKLGTAYSMYFNIKNERTGGLFAKPFRSRHVSDDRYLQKIIQYIHCNPAELFEQNWKRGRVSNARLLQQKLLTYPYSSLGTYSDQTLPLAKILDHSIFSIETQMPSRQMIKEAQGYYAEIGKASP